MLILSRKTGERILIGDDIVITVLDYRQGETRLGIEAPLEVSIARMELVPGSKEFVELKG